MFQLYIEHKFVLCAIVWCEADTING